MKGVWFCSLWHNLLLFYFFNLLWEGDPFEIIKRHELSGTRDSVMVSYTLLSSYSPNCRCSANVTA